MQSDQRVSRYVDDGNRYERLVQMFGQIAVEALANGIECAMEIIECDRGKIVLISLRYDNDINFVFRNNVSFSVQEIMTVRDINIYIQSGKDIIHRMIGEIARKAHGPYCKTFIESQNPEEKQ